MGWMASRGSVGTALDASEAASGKSAPPPPFIRPCFPLLLTHAWHGNP